VHGEPLANLEREFVWGSCLIIERDLGCTIDWTSMRIARYLFLCTVTVKELGHLGAWGGGGGGNLHVVGFYFLFSASCLFQYEQAKGSDEKNKIDLRTAT